MAEAASSASVSIAEPRTSATGRLGYRFVVKTAEGSPLAGAEVDVTLTGDGSFAPNFSSKEVKRELDSEGSAVVTWFRRSIFDRDVRATLTVIVPRAGCSIAIEPTDAHDHGPRTSYAGTRLR